MVKYTYRDYYYDCEQDPEPAKVRPQNPIKWIIVLLVFFILPVGMVILILINALNTPLALKISDLTKYQEVRKKVLWEPVRSQFPKDIPNDPEKVKMNVIESNWLDPYGLVQLRMNLAPSEIDHLYKKYDASKIAQIAYGTEHHDFPSVWEVLGEKEERDDFTFFVLDENLKHLKKEKDRPYTFGVAISKKLNAIIYWVRYWNG